jgi:hypothetical protein
VPVLLGFAAELEAERDHVIATVQRDAEDELAEAQRTRNTPDAELDGPKFEALKASATFDRVLFDGGEFGTATEAGSLEEADYLGLPGLLEPDQVALLLRKRQTSQLSSRTVASKEAGPATLFDTPDASAATPGTGVPGTGAAATGGPGASGTQRQTVSREALAALRKELNGLVGAWSHRTGQPHGVIHSELRKACGGPAIPQASAEQIQARIEMIRKWALSRR